MRSHPLRPFPTAISVALLLAACGTAGDAETPATGSGDVARGEELFATNCAACHGPDAQGTNAGPGFLDDIYVPSHHGDAAFQLAVERGVQPHHWDFGAMPPVPGLSQQDVVDITAYVRQLQRDAGLIE